MIYDILPLEILNKVLKYLAPQDFARLSQASQLSKYIAYENLTQPKMVLEIFTQLPAKVGAKFREYYRTTEAFKALENMYNADASQLTDDQFCCYIFATDDLKKINLNQFKLLTEKLYENETVLKNKDLTFSIYSTKEIGNLTNDKVKFVLDSFKKIYADDINRMNHFELEKLLNELFTYLVIINKAETFDGLTHAVEKFKSITADEKSVLFLNLDDIEEEIDNAKEANFNTILAENNLYLALAIMQEAAIIAKNLEPLVKGTEVTTLLHYDFESLFKFLTLRDAPTRNKEASFLNLSGLILVFLNNYRMFSYNASDNAIPANLNLSGVCLQNSYFIAANLEHTNLSHANLRNSQFENLLLNHVDLSNADLSNTVFSRCMLTNVHLENVCMKQSVLNPIFIQDTVIPSAVLETTTKAKVLDAKNYKNLIRGFYEIAFDNGSRIFIPIKYFREHFVQHLITGLRYSHTINGTVAVQQFLILTKEKVCQIAKDIVHILDVELELPAAESKKIIEALLKEAEMFKVEDKKKFKSEMKHYLSQHHLLGQRQQPANDVTDGRMVLKLYLKDLKARLHPKIELIKERCHIQ